jgi:hypothetical protein
LNTLPKSSPTAGNIDLGDESEDSPKIAASEKKENVALQINQDSEQKSNITTS